LDAEDVPNKGKEGGMGGTDGPMNGYVYGEEDIGDVEDDKDIVVVGRSWGGDGSTWYPAPSVSLAKHGWR
jgi:hypothetical protein